MCLILPVSNNLLKLRTPFNVSILGIKLTPSGSISHIKFTSAISSIFEVAKYLIKKTFDSIHHLGLGTYGNRVAAIDILTKRFDEKSFSYFNEYPTLNTMDVGGLLSPNSLYKFSGSTHTRYIPTELLSSSIPTGVPTNFTTKNFGSL